MGVWSPLPESFEMMRARRDVLLGVDPAVKLLKRAVVRLEDGRTLHGERVDDGGLVMQRSETSIRFWTWAGLRANQTLIAAMGLSDSATASNEGILLPVDVGVADVRRANVREAVPWISPDAVAGLKFSAALPGGLALRRHLQNGSRIEPWHCKLWLTESRFDRRG